MYVCRHRLRLLLVLAIAALSLALVPGAVAAPLTGSAYDTGDGNQDNALGRDWQGAYAAGAVKESPDANDDCFVGGVKELAPRAWAFNSSPGGCTPGKSNLRVAYVNAESASATTFGHFAFFRNDTTGNTFLTFELNQGGTSWRNATGTTIPCRSDGDVLLSFEVGGSSLTTSLYQWVGDGTGPAECPNGASGTFLASGTIPSGRFQGAMNSGSAIANYVNAATYGATFPANAFGEAAIDLPAVLKAMGQSPCFGFLQMQVHSRSSSSISSAMIDYTKPVPVALQSCAVTGNAYQDTNGDGARDGGEPGVAGFELYDDVNDNGVRDAGEPYGTSDADGFYRILGVGAGAHRIREAARAGWRCTQPAPCAYSRTMTTGGNSTGNDFGNTGPATASGTTFDDTDGDGVRDAGEPGLAGMTFYVDLDDDGVKDAGEPAGASDAGGAWSIFDIPAGSYRIREAPPAGWTCSAPSPCAAPQTFSSGSAATGIVFGNYAGATIAGTLYEDTNGDGAAKTTGDPALAGWQVYLDANGNDTYDLGERQTATDASGGYAFSGLAPGTYTARVTPVASTWYCTRPAAGAGCERTVSVTSGQSSSGNDVGLSRTATVSGSVFNDANGNGTKDAGETAWTSGATVYVDYDGNGALDPAEPAATVDGTGAWSIANVKIGAWSVREAPGAFSCTAPASCAFAVTLASGQSAAVGQFGDYYNQQSSVSGTVLLDANANNVKDAGEATGLAGLTVYADDNKNGSLDAGESNAVTNAAGAYSVTFAGNGNVTVRTVPRSGWTCSFPTANQCSITVTGLGKGQYATGKDFGLYGPAAISGTVVHDANGNGVRDAGEGAGLSGRTVYVDANGNGALDAGETSAPTGATGDYTISGVAPGTYTVRLAASAGWTCSMPSQCKWTVTMAAANVTGRDFAAYTTGLVGGVLYEDANANGARDAGEAALSGRTVYLDANGNGTKDAGETTATTDATGAYSFVPLAPGAYTVRQVLPAGWTQSAPAGAQTLTVTSQATATAAAMGSYAGATVSGKVFADANFDGSAYQSGDALLSGRTVYLDLDGDGAPGAGEPTATSDAFGAYSFSGLVPGTYTVRAVTPAGWACVYPSGCSRTVTLASQGVAAGRDFGTYLGASVSGTVFEDADADGAAREPGEAGLDGMRVYLDADGDATRDAGEPSTVTDASGAYAFTGVVAQSWTVRADLPSGWTCDRPAPCGHDVTLTSGSASTAIDFGVHTTGSISGHLYTDRDHDAGPQVFGENDQPLRTVFADTDDDGTLDAGEPRATTDDRGDYTLPGLAPGTYRVRQVLPDGWSCSTPEPCAWSVTLTSRQVASGKDFSSWTGASFSGTAFEDRDGDGDFPEPDEGGLVGRTVYVDADDDGTLDDGEPQTTTDADGAYAFSDLAPGTYAVRMVAASGWTCSYPAAACATSLTLEAGEAAQDVDFGAWTTGTVAGVAFDDADRSGTRDGGESALAGATVYADLDDDGTRDAGEPSAQTDADGAYELTLGPGGYTLRESGPSGWLCTAPASCARTVDVSSRGAVTGADFGNRTGTGAISGTVFEDVDGDGERDAGEAGNAGVTVFDDVDGDGEHDAGETATTTGADGAYRFASLPAGDHAIRAQAPGGWLCVTANCRVAVAVGIDADVAGRDIALARPASIAGTGFEDADGDGSAREAGDAAAPDWQIDLDGPTTRTVTTDADGAYVLGDLAPGTYTVRAAARAGWSCAYPASCEWTVTVTSGAAVTAKDFGASRQTSVAGTVYEDRDADGARDAGDGGRSGVDVWVDYDGDGNRDAGEPAATTGADGAYAIDRIDPGAWTLRAAAGDGWSCAAPTVCASAITLASGTMLDGRDFATWTHARIGGELFDDADGDGGPRAAGDAPLAGTVRLSRDGVTVATATGDPSTGAYTLTGIRPGTYALAADLDGTCTRPANCTRTVTVASGDALTGADFAGYAAATMSGTVHDDTDGDGAVDPGEPGAALGVVWADLDGDGARTAADASTTVAADGAWTLGGLAPGPHTVRLEPAGGAVCATAAACAVSRTVTSGETASGIDLAAYRPASIAGTVSTPAGPLADRVVWLDTDRDGDRDGSEPATRAAADGGYSFAGLAPGGYVVRLELPAGEVCSAPAGCRREPSLVSGAAATGNDFAVYRLAGLHGTVSEDANADGDTEPGDDGIAGVTAYIDADGDAERDGDEPAATTASDGTYAFTGLAPGSYTVRLDAPAAFTCSAPAGCSRTRTLASGEAAGGLDFALWRTGSVSGLVFTDKDGNGRRDAGEPPHGAATVFADTDDDGRLDAGEPVATTAADGGYSLTGIRPGTVALRVQAPADWTCTGPGSCRAAATVASGRATTAADLGLRKTAPPVADDKATTGANGAAQSQTLPVPPGGSVTLLDADDGPTLRLVVAGQGEYVLDPATARVTFTPLAGFTGTATPVRYRITDADGASADAVYAPTVQPSMATAPAADAPAAAPVPAPRTCISRRGMTIHWKVPRGVRLRRVRVTVNGRVLARLRGSARRAVIDMKGRPRQTVRVRVSGLARGGRTLATQRTYVTCTPHLAHPPLETLRLRPKRAR